ncbi:unnamed protein product [Boreogadus saida]
MCFVPIITGTGLMSTAFAADRTTTTLAPLRLVRSTSMLVIGEKTQTAPNSTLKRSKSSVSIESTTALYYYQRQEDQIWLYSQNQNCLEYLEELVALRRQYTRSVHDLTSSELKASVSTKKRAAPPPPPKHAQWRQAPKSTTFIPTGSCACPEWAEGPERKRLLPRLAVALAPPRRKSSSGSTSSRLRLQRNPIHLPKVVESAFQTLRFKPNLKKQ